MNYNKYSEFLLNNDADCSGTYKAATIRLSPKDLVRVFGDGKHRGYYKTTGEYRFVHVKTGAVFTLYDCKQTSAYDYSYTTPNEFWALTDAEFHIGGKTDNVEALYELISMLQSYCRSYVDHGGTFFLGGKL